MSARQRYLKREKIKEKNGRKYSGLELQEKASRNKVKYEEQPYWRGAGRLGEEKKETGSSSICFSQEIQRPEKDNGIVDPEEKAEEMKDEKVEDSVPKLPPIYVQPPRPSLWSTPLVKRIDKPMCGCLRCFDPVSQAEITDCGVKVQTLLQLSRNCILRTIPITKLTQVRHRLPLPTLLVKELCQLRLTDFIINPYTVSSENIEQGVYPAILTFTGQKVQLTITPLEEATTEKEILLPGHQVFFSDSSQTQPDILAQFVDRGVHVRVHKVTVSLQDMLQAQARVGKPLTHSFMWQVIKSVAQYILSRRNRILQPLDLSHIRLSNNSIFIEHQPQLVSTQQVTEHTTNVQWTVQPPQGNSRSLMKHPTHQESTRCIGNLVQQMLSVNQNIALRQQTPQNRLLRRRGARKVREFKSHSSRGEMHNAEQALSTLMQRCLSQNIQQPPTIREIIQIAHMHLGKPQMFPPIKDTHQTMH